MKLAVQLWVDGELTSSPNQTDASELPSTRNVHVAGAVPETETSMV